MKAAEIEGGGRWGGEGRGGEAGGRWVYCFCLTFQNQIDEAAELEMDEPAPSNVRCNEDTRIACSAWLFS